MTTKSAEKQLVNLDMTIGEVVQKFPKAADIMLGYGLHCVGCAVNPYETIEQGALGHGMDEEMIRDMMEDINMVVNKKPSFDLNPDGITLSPRAVETLKLIAETDQKKRWGLQVKAEKAEGGLDYFLDIVEKAQNDEKTYAWQGVDLFISDATMMLMRPSLIDYVKSVSNEGFNIISLAESKDDVCPCGKPLADCGCKNGEGCQCGKGGCS